MVVNFIISLLGNSLIVFQFHSVHILLKYSEYNRKYENYNSQYFWIYRPVKFFLVIVNTNLNNFD